MTPWIVAHQAPLSIEFFWQEYWSGLSFPSPGDLTNPSIEAGSPILQSDYLPSESPRKPLIYTTHTWMWNSDLLEGYSRPINQVWGTSVYHVLWDHTVSIAMKLVMHVCSFAQLHPTLYNLIDWSGLSFLLAGDLPAEIKSVSPALQVDSLPLSHVVKLVIISIVYFQGG